MERKTCIKVLTIILTGILTAVGICGCAALAVGAGAAAGAIYMQGDLEGTMKAPLDVVHAASVDALNEMDIAVIQKPKSALDAQIVGRTAMDEKVQITLTKTETDATKINIRVGTFGDEQMSREIYDNIKQNL